MATDLIRPSAAPAEPLVISTEVCPHCGAERTSVTPRSGGMSRSLARYWEIRWQCGSQVLLIGKTCKLSLSAKCNPGFQA
jgi:hypothetical protein